MSFENSEDIIGIIQALKQKPGALLPVLHGIQEKLGYVPPEAVPIIASELNLTRAAVHGVVTSTTIFVPSHLDVRRQSVPS